MESALLLFEEFKVYKKYNFLNYIRIRNWLFQNLQEMQRTRFYYYIMKSWRKKFYLEAFKFSKINAQFAYFPTNQTFPET